MSKIEALKNIPDVEFCTKSTEQINSEMIADYSAKYAELTGKVSELSEASPERLILGAAALQLSVLAQSINVAGQSNFLKYSSGNALDNLAALKGLTRKPPSSATVQVRFSISDARTSVVSIPGGTRVSTDKRQYFSTDEYCEISAGQLSVTVSATAITPGTSENGIPTGAITTIVDPIPYVAAVTNITVSAGGSDTESDDDLTLRTYLAPASYSVAGPAQAYKYWAKQFRSDVDDVEVTSPDAGTVSVVFSLEGGVEPSSEDISAMTAYLSADTIRPLTDNVVVSAPTQVDYSIALTYYISKSDSASATSIQCAVSDAVDAYKLWQAKIGRDINPSELIRRVMQAGARRVAITTPAYSVIEAGCIAKCTSITSTYGGLEDD